MAALPDQPLDGGMAGALGASVTAPEGISPGIILHLLYQLPANTSR
jgi:hypothetical protein